MKELKQDVLGVYHYHRDAARQAVAKRRILGHTAQARLAYKLYEILCGWCGKQEPEQYIEREIAELSPIERNTMRKILRELGYTLSGGVQY